MGLHAATATTIGALSGLSVLVIDDHMDSLERIADVLQGAGAVAVGVRTANAASFATVARFDAIAVDLTEGAWTKACASYASCMSLRLRRVRRRSSLRLAALRGPT